MGKVSCSAGCETIIDTNLDARGLSFFDPNTTKQLLRLSITQAEHIFCFETRDEAETRERESLMSHSRARAFPAAVECLQIL